jgi:tetrapyrrole methylase family protein/MazG family protein
MLTSLEFLEPTLKALKVDRVDNLQISYAITVARQYHPPLETGRPALVTHLQGQDLAGRVMDTLLNAYASDHPISLVQAAGSEAERVWRCPLAQLNRQSGLDDPTTIYLPAQTSDGSFSSFQDTIAHLRSPEGCPWDREQTHRSLRPYLLEESYEVLEALDAGDPAALAEELGDLLLQIVLHTQIAIDQDEFKMEDVISHINRKLRRRHPHVFSDVLVNGVAEVALNWESIKRAEKASRNHRGAEAALAQPPSALDGVPRGMPALAEALAISKKAVRVGFEWPNIDGVLDKLVEEAHEIAGAVTEEELEAEIGDLLFSAVNLARWRNVDAESALRATNARFIRRFKTLEALAAAQNKSLSNMPIEEMDALWDRAKTLE